MTGSSRNPTLQRWLPVIVLPPILLLDGVAVGEGRPTSTSSASCVTYVAVLPLAVADAARASSPWRRCWSAASSCCCGTTSRARRSSRSRPGRCSSSRADYGRRETIIAAVALRAVRARERRCRSRDNGEELVSLTLRNLALCELALAVGYLMWHNRAALEREVAAREAEAERRLGEERLRIAREVHDVVAHAMVAINVQAGVAAHLIEQRRRAGARGAAAHQAHERRRADRPARDARRPARPRPGGTGRAGRRARRPRRGRRAAARAGVEVTVDVDTVGVVPDAGAVGRLPDRAGGAHQRAAPRATRRRASASSCAPTRTC